MNKAIFTIVFLVLRNKYHIYYSSLKQVNVPMILNGKFVFNVQLVQSVSLSGGLRDSLYQAPPLLFGQSYN